MSPEEQLKYWSNRGGQIEWRLQHAKEVVAEMQRDLAECDGFIKSLREQISVKPTLAPEDSGKEAT